MFHLGLVRSLLAHLRIHLRQERWGAPPPFHPSSEPDHRLSLQMGCVCFFASSALKGRKEGRRRYFSSPIRFDNCPCSDDMGYVFASCVKDYKPPFATTEELPPRLSQRSGTFPGLLPHPDKWGVNFYGRNSPDANDFWPTRQPIDVSWAY